MENQIDLCKEEAALVLELLKESEIDPKYCDEAISSRNQNIIALMNRIEKAFPELAS